MPLKSLIPKPMRTWLRDRLQKTERGLLVFDRVSDWRVLRRVRPYRLEFGKRRGSFIDRFYIEKFIASHKQFIFGVVAEFESDQYIRKFGEGNVQRSEILDINRKNDRRTMTLDLTQSKNVPSATFDCVICTQTLFLMQDFQTAVHSLHKMLKPGGCVLVTVPGICPRITGQLIAGEGQDWWRFTSRSAEHAFAICFGREHVAVQTYGNVLTATAFMHGLVQEELTQEELEFNDPDFELIIGVKAIKPRANEPHA